MIITELFWRKNPPTVHSPLLLSPWPRFVSPSRRIVDLFFPDVMGEHLPLQIDDVARNDHAGPYSQPPLLELPQRFRHFILRLGICVWVTATL